MEGVLILAVVELVKFDFTMALEDTTFVALDKLVDIAAITLLPMTSWVAIATATSGDGRGGVALIALVEPAGELFSSAPLARLLVMLAVTFGVGVFEPAGLMLA